MKITSLGKILKVLFCICQIKKENWYGNISDIVINNKVTENERCKTILWKHMQRKKN